MTIHSIVIQKLLSTNAHLGRRVAAHQFKIFTYGSRNGMTIIDSDKTLICLRNACNFVACLARNKGRFLFVNTNSLFDEIIEQMTQRIGVKTNNALWRMSGFLTNSSSPKKFRSRNKKLCFGPSQPPDCVVVVDTERKSSVIAEADRLQIPIVALVDSSMPSETYKKITYPVPANDSVQFVYLFCNLITKTFLLEQRKFAAFRGDTEINASTAVQLDRSLTKKDDKRQTEQSKNANTEVHILPYDSLAPFSNDAPETKDLLDKLVVFNLNGASGTRMGFDGPNSSIAVRNDMTFLDLIVNQIESLNTKHGCSIPLLLLNTAETHDDTVKVLEKYSGSNIDIRNFRQSTPTEVKSLGGQNEIDECHPFDHGEGLLSLLSSGTLDALLSQGKEYVLMVDSDNLAAAVDPKILNHLFQNNIDCCMEVIPTVFSGFSAANSPIRKYKLEEVSRSPPKHSSEKFKLIDTRNLWVNLKATKRLMEAGRLKVDNYPVLKKMENNLLLQETAAESAIRFFDRAVGISVPRSRFFYMESTSDLFLLKSDLYTAVEGALVRNKARRNPENPLIVFGPEFEMVGDFLKRFSSVPSILELDSLKVDGDVWFGSGITLKGKVSITAKPGEKLVIPDGTVLENKEISSAADL